MGTEPRKNFADEFNRTIIQGLKEGTAPWIKPWKAGEFHAPLNPASGTVYRGINYVMLSSRGYNDPRWLTYKQAREHGWQVKKGEKSEKVVYWQWKDKRIAKDADGKPVEDQDGNKVFEETELTRPRMYVYSVFHASQLVNEKGEAIPPFEPAREAVTRIAGTADLTANRILRASGAVIKNDQRNRAFYRPADDEIHLPPQEHFTSSGQYYETALHELGHWTGHPSRLDRDLSGTFGSDEYAREELRAEIASWMVSQEIGLPHNPANHLSYVDSWVKILESDPQEIMRACAAAEKIRGFLMELEQKLEPTTLSPSAAMEKLEAEHEQFARLDHDALAAFKKVQSRAEELGFSAVLTYRDKADKFLDDAIENDCCYCVQYFQNGNFTGIESHFSDYGQMYTTENGIRVTPNDIFYGDVDSLDRSLDRFAKDQLTQVKPDDVRLLVQKSIEAKGEIQFWDNATYRRISEEKFYFLIDGLKTGNFTGAYKSLLKLADIENDCSPLPVATTFQDVVALFEEKIEKRDLCTVEEYERPVPAAQGLRQPLPEAEPASPEERKMILDKLAPYFSSASVLNLDGERRRGTRDIPREAVPKEGTTSTEKTWLNVPFKEKDFAKAAGAKWDRESKRWYAPAGADLAAFDAWLWQKDMVRAEAAVSPAAEFAGHLRDAGLVVDEPILDGQIHRVPVAGAKPGTKDGAYCGHADGIPAGWYQNYKTGEQAKWVYTGHSLTPHAQELMRQCNTRCKEDKAEIRHDVQEKAMKRAYAKWMHADPAQEHEYLRTKGVSGDGLRIDPQGNLLVPGFNVETGRLQTLQRISPTGGKWFEKDCPKAGALTTIPYGVLANGEHPEIVLIAEGYATGASLHEATGLPVAVAFDAGNLSSAALAIRKKFPDAAITICADNDHEHPSGHNVGLDKAKEAADLVNGKVIAPEFTPEEKQKKLTDFNDLQKSRGNKAVREMFLEASVEVHEEIEEVER